MNGGETEKESLECRYGKKQLMELIDNFQAESWIDKHSKKCPHCGAPIEVMEICLLAFNLQIMFLLFEFHQTLFFIIIVEERRMQQNVLSSMQHIFLLALLGISHFIFKCK